MIEIESVVIDEESYLTNYNDGDAFLRCAMQFKHQGARPSLVFNTASVALERYLVALCELYGEMPRNHNYITLIKTVEPLVKIPNELNRRIKAMDWIFGICSIDAYRHPDPDASDMENVLYLCTEVQKLFDPLRIQAVNEAIIVTTIEAPRGKPRGIFDSKKETRLLLANPAASSGECARGIQSVN